MKYNLPMFRISLWCLLLLTLLYMHSVLAQKQDKKKLNYRAETLTNGSREGETFKKLIGNVVFEQEGTTIYADSAYFFDQRNLAEAY
ncbi:MAG: hypothetical protein MI674_02625, partial [Cytophagales bacterium]|nr:hypothetical protein [Cytophagales bacterium]